MATAQVETFEETLDCQDIYDTIKNGAPAMDRLIIIVKEIKGNCPVYKVGNKIVLDDGYRVNCKESCDLCMHSLSSILPYYVALFHEVDPIQLRLTKDGRKAYVQCLDPCNYTGGGTVVFEMEKVMQG